MTYTENPPASLSPHATSGRGLHDGATRSVAGSRRLTALVIDSHPLLRDAVISRLSQLGVAVIDEAGSLAEALARANGSGPRDLAVTDLSLPDGTALDLIPALRAAGWDRTLVLTAADDPQSVRAAFIAGVQGYLLKSSSTATVAEGLSRVLAGGVYADPAVASVLAQGVRGSAGRRGLSDLSGREVEVITLVSRGRSNKEIGEALSLSALTVKSHLSRIARKLGTGDRAQMVAMVMRAGLIR